MHARMTIGLFFILLCSETSIAQFNRPPASGISRDGIRTADERGNAADALANPPNLGSQAAPPAAANAVARPAGQLVPIPMAQGEPSLGRISKGAAALPNDAGQVWREYDLTPYTSKIANGVGPNGNRAEQAVIDWILRETGTDAWFQSPLGILNADRDTLRVYHTTQMHEVVKGVYDRFMASSAQPVRISVRIVSTAGPSWRSRAQPLLKSIEVKSTGVDAWIVSREHAFMLLQDLRNRADYREIGSQTLDIPNGQTQPIGMTRPKTYVRGVKNRTDVVAGYEPEMGTIDEGFALALSPLMSVDSRTIDFTAKCNIDQVEKLIPVPLDVASAAGVGRRVEIQVPQIVSWRLHERFRWPADQVLVMSCGIVGTPRNEASGGIPFLSAITSSNRADALMFIAVEGPGSSFTVPFSPVPGGLAFAPGAAVNSPMLPLNLPANSSLTGPAGFPPRPEAASPQAGSPTQFTAQPPVQPRGTGLNMPFRR